MNIIERIDKIIEYEILVKSCFKISFLIFSVFSLLIISNIITITLNKRPTNTDRETVRGCVVQKENIAR